MNIRDPRKHPEPGDVITRWGSTREVLEIQRNERGTITHVVYAPSANDTPGIEATISSWRAWAKTDAQASGNA